MNVSSPHRRFRPCPEALEDRCCLSAATVSIIILGGRTLQITGTRSADRISVVGTADGKLMVTAGRAAPRTFAGIERLGVSTVDGKDQVSCDTSVVRLADVNIDLGKGADSLTFRSGRAPQNGLFQGGDGKDIIDISYGGGGGESSFNPQPEPPGRVALKILGGKSRDMINFALRGRFRDDLDATLDGGTDADLVNALFAPAHDSPGHIRGRVVGGPANDRLTVNNARLDSSALFDLLIDGGRGTDRARVGPNAQVQGIEKPTQAGIWVQ